jgi:hypothetical protein
LFTAGGDKTGTYKKTANAKKKGNQPVLSGILHSSLDLVSGNVIFFVRSFAGFIK